MNASTRRSGRTRRSPPTSLPDHFARKGYLSVSDLVGPAWCEYNYQYGILSLSHLPPSQRPATITTEAGQTLAAAPQLVAQKETTLNAGKAVHTVLEREVAPVLVHVETETKEDSWALRLLNLWCDVQGLLQLKPGKGKGRGKESACVREVPVYGWIHGVLVMGVIDEIEKRSIELGAPEKQPAKTWASQEEWKKDQLRKTSPKKPRPKSGEAKQQPIRTLASFFGSQPEQQTDKQEATENPIQSSPGWAYFLSDTKTRIASWLPAEEDQFSARMQCMTYKRLFDGLLLGALSSSSGPSSPSFASSAGLDPNATPMDWARTFTALDLDPFLPLSTAFLRDAEPLCESWGTDLTLFVAQNDADVCTLHHVRLLLEQGLCELARDALRGQGLGEQEGSGGAQGVIQDRLALTYRRQTQRRRRKRKKAAQVSSPKKEMGDKTESNLRQTTLYDVTAGVGTDTLQENGAMERDTADSKVEADMTEVPVTDAVESVETRKSIDALDGRTEALHAIEQALSSPPPCTPRKPSQSSTALPSSPPSPPSPTPPSQNTSTTSPTSPVSPRALPDTDTEASAVIGVVTFSHDAARLDAYLRRMIAMWTGERGLVGVSLDQTRRCWTCEWMQGCEWRAAQSDRHAAAAAAKHAAKVSRPVVADQETLEAEEGDEFWSTLDYDAIEVRDAAGNLLDW